MQLSLYSEHFNDIEVSEVDLKEALEELSGLKPRIFDLKNTRIEPGKKIQKSQPEIRAVFCFRLLQCCASIAEPGVAGCMQNQSLPTTDQSTLKLGARFMTLLLHFDAKYQVNSMAFEVFASLASSYRCLPPSTSNLMQPLLSNSPFPW